MKLKYILIIVSLIFTCSISAQNINAKPKKKKHFTYTSFYYTTKSDSTKLAVDLFLPSKVKEGEKIPTIFYLTRYIRSLRLRKFFRWLQNPLFGQVPKKEVEYFTKNGYAIVIMDARGSGASFGNRMMDFTPQEMWDGAEVIDWIVAQPWSNGNVGTTGISYLGTTSELILMTQHPAIKAAIPRSNIYDLYGDIAFPGGIRQGPFVRVWGKTTRGLDYNDFSFVKGLPGVLEGVNPVMGDTDKVMLKQAVAKHHENYDVFNEILRIEFRDELHPVLKQPIDSFSIHTNIEKIKSSGTPIFRIGGWYDGALANSVFKGLWNNPNTHGVLIGPWDHGPRDNASPYAKSPKVKFDVFGSMLKFFDWHLKPNMFHNEVSDTHQYVQYYTVGEEKWHTTTSWPPANVINTLWYFGSDTMMHFKDTLLESKIDVSLKYNVGTGGGSRYNSQTTLYKYEKHTNYKKRKKQIDSLFYFETNILQDTITISGHVQAILNCSFKTEDATVFIYLDEITPKGEVKYITEGMFRAVHRKITDSKGYITPGHYHSFKMVDQLKLVPDQNTLLSFALLPISYQVKKGSKIRVSFTGIDPEHFDVPFIKPDHMKLNVGGNGGSVLIMPLEQN